MVELPGADIEQPVAYVAANVAVWGGMFVSIALIAGGDPTDAAVAGVFGGFAFGVASWYLKQRD
jgi:hypothetical protein